MEQQSGPGNTADSGRTTASDGESADVATRFRMAWAGSSDELGVDPLLVPERLAAACATVLPIDGAGLSVVYADFRVPLGASDPLAALAEQIQFTQGEGPCLDAVRGRRILTVGERDMSRRWPQFAQELLSRTPYRAVIGMPLTSNTATCCALNLFLIDEMDLPHVGLADASTVAAAIEDVLVHELPAVPSTWLSVRAARGRRTVWIAMGMLRGRFHCNGADAIASLRAYAYGHDTVVDVVAARLVDGTLDPNELSYLRS